MPHIELSNDLPGIRSLVAYRKDTGLLLYELAEALLRNESPIAPAERELIAAFVSRGNKCRFCTNSHAAASRELFNNNKDLVDQALKDYRQAPVSNKLKALLQIADKVRNNGKLVDENDIENARNEGAGDREIHDAVLIAAAFSMYNRYVDGLSTLSPENESDYEEMGKKMAEQGYVRRFNQVVVNK